MRFEEKINWSKTKNHKRRLHIPTQEIGGGYSKPTINKNSNVTLCQICWYPI